MSAPGLEAFHLGFVVRDVDAVASLYGRILGIQGWRVTEYDMSTIPWAAQPTDARLKIAYGRAARQTFELIQVLDGRSVHSEFLEQHGEGVQHIGFWCPDVRVAVTSAVAEGATVVCAYLKDETRAVVQLNPGPSATQIAQVVDADRMAYVNPGLAGVQFEFCGPASAAGVRAWLQAEYQKES